ncbi:MAG: lectin like domain-containing protein, partial [bacterium]
MHPKKTFFIIIFSFLNIFALAPSFAPVNPEYRELSFPKSIINFSNILKNTHKTSFVPPPVYLPHLKYQRPSNIYIPLSFDEQFDLRDYNRDTPVKNQGSCGSCWAFSSISSLESALYREGVMDFSENNLNNRHGFDIPRCEGGNYHMSTAYFARMSGPVEEHLDPYISTSSPSDIPPARFVTNIRFINKDMIKQAVVESGGVATTMYWNSQFYNSSESSYYCGSSYTPNHGVTIIGWDDNYSRYNFSQNPPGNGAWIVKNSWGKSWGENGYFYMSYYDAAGMSYNVVFEESLLPDYVDNVYQHDPLGWVSSMGYGNETAFMANVFTARKDEVLTSVGFYTGSLNSSCEIQIHVEPDSGPLFSGGAEFVKSVTIPYAGYNVIDLGEDIPLEAGTDFSVVVKIHTPSYKYPIPVERPRSGYSSSANAENGESFISPDGQSWQDLNKHSSNTNVCVKAFTVDKPTRTLSINFPGEGHGKVVSQDGSIKCFESCTLSVEPGSSFTFDAEAEESSIFQGWEGSGCEGTDSCSIVVDSDTEISAEFTLKQYSISISGVGNGTLYPEGEITVKHGKNLYVEIDPDEGYFVENVVVDGGSLGDSVYDYLFSDVTGDHTLTAYFADSEGRCYTPSDFYERSYSSYLNYSFYGPINEYGVEFNPGNGNFTARIRAKNTDVSSLSRRAEYYPLDDIISVRTIGVENS